MKNPQEHNKDIFQLLQDEVAEEQEDDILYRVLKQLRTLFQPEEGWENIKEIDAVSALEELFSSTCLGVDVSTEYSLPPLFKGKNEDPSALVKKFVKIRKENRSEGGPNHMIIRMKRFGDRFIVTDYPPEDPTVGDVVAYMVLSTGTGQPDDFLYLCPLKTFAVMNENEV